MTALVGGQRLDAIDRLSRLPEASSPYRGSTYRDQLLQNGSLTDVTEFNQNLSDFTQLVLDTRKTSSTVPAKDSWKYLNRIKIELDRLKPAYFPAEHDLNFWICIDFFRSLPEAEEITSDGCTFAEIFADPEIVNTQIFNEKIRKFMLEFIPLFLARENDLNDLELVERGLKGLGMRVPNALQRQIEQIKCLDYCRSLPEAQDLASESETYETRFAEANLSDVLPKFIQHVHEKTPYQPGLSALEQSYSPEEFSQQQQQNSSVAEKIVKLRHYSVNLGLLDEKLYHTWELYFHLDKLASLPEAQAFVSLFKNGAYFNETVLIDHLVLITRQVVCDSRFLPGIDQIEKAAQKNGVTMEQAITDNDVEKMKLEILLYLWDFLQLRNKKRPSDWPNEKAWPPPEAFWPNNRYGSSQMYASGFTAK